MPLAYWAPKWLPTDKCGKEKPQEITQAFAIGTGDAGRGESESELRNIIIH